MPLVLVGVGAGNLLPRAGYWLVVTKAIFGFILLGVALWIVQPVLPAWLAMVAWAVLLIAAAVFLRTFDSLPADAGPLPRLGKVVGVVLALAGPCNWWAWQRAGAIRCSRWRGDARIGGRSAGCPRRGVPAREKRIGSR